MGVMRFIVDRPELLSDWPELQRGFLSGFDQSIWPTRVERFDSVVTCRRASSDSGRFQVAWPVAGFGRPMVSTASLPEREEPYVLAVELARGKIVQLRNQLAFWQWSGMQIPDEVAPLQRSAQRLLAQAVARQSDLAAASALAQQALEQAFQGADLLTRAYVRQRLGVRHAQYPQLPTVLGCSLGDTLLPDEQEQVFAGMFSGAGIPVQWRVIEPREGEYHWDVSDHQVEWALRHRLLIRGGPLLDLGPGGLPTWLSNWSHDLWNLQSFVCDFVETALTRYLGKIRIWELAARANTGGALELPEDARLTLVAKILEAARRVDEDGQFLLRIDQPWGDYQVEGRHRLSPLQFADALLRAGISLATINLEIAVGYHPTGSPSRDLLEFSRLIDTWSGLGIPLQVTLAFPSTGGSDPKLTLPSEVEPRSWREPVSELTQAKWLEEHVSLLLAKPGVVAVFWNHLSDAQPHRYPHAGLLAADGRAKPALDSLRQLRAEHWPRP